MKSNLLIFYDVIECFKSFLKSYDPDAFGADDSRGVSDVMRTDAFRNFDPDLLAVDTKLEVTQNAPKKYLPIILMYMYM